MEIPPFNVQLAAILTHKPGIGRKVMMFVFLSISLNSLASEKPKPTSSQKAPVKELCAVPGLYREYPMGDGSLIVTCHLVSTNTCLYLPGPCPHGTAQGNNGKTVPAPIALNVREGQPFFARYNDKGEFVVTLVESYELTEGQCEDGTTMLSLTYK